MTEPSSPMFKPFIVFRVAKNGEFDLQFLVDDDKAVPQGATELMAVNGAIHCIQTMFDDYTRNVLDAYVQKMTEFQGGMPEKVH
jgi:hypothetical protein